MPRLHMFVYGIVQGVSFRAFVEQNARVLGLKGFARNCNDGSVEVTVEGSRDRLERLLEALKKGPRGAHVERIDSDWSKETGEYGGFTVG